jgi:hypothetical protein
MWIFFQNHLHSGHSEFYAEHASRGTQSAKSKEKMLAPKPLKKRALKQSIMLSSQSLPFFQQPPGLGEEGPMHPANDQGSSPSKDILAEIIRETIGPLDETFALEEEPNPMPFPDLKQQFETLFYF